MHRTSPDRHPARPALRAALGAFALTAAWLSAPALAAGPVTVTVLHQFTGVTGNATVAGTGARPYAAPVYRAADQKLYGSAHLRGASNTGSLVWSLDPAQPMASNGFFAANAGIQLRTGFTMDPAGLFFVGTQGTARTFPATLLSSSASGAWAEIAGTNSTMGLSSTAADGSVYLPGALSDSAGYTAQIYRYANGALQTLATGFTHSIGLSNTVIADTSGTLYGVMAHVRNGGSYETGYTYSEPFIYRLDPTLGVYEKMADFTAATGYPTADALISVSLIDGGDGWLYGTTFNSFRNLANNPTNNTGVTDPGNNDHLGKVYRISKTKGASSTYAIEILHSFTNTAGAGVGAAGQLVKATDGHIYGTTMYGGTEGNGTIWRLVLGGAAPIYEVVHSLTLAEGARANGLTQGEDHVLYGSARFGGLAEADSGNGGTVFKVELSKPARITTFQATTETTQTPNPVNLSWSSENATGCLAGGDNGGAWSGEQPTAGSNVPTRALTQLGSNTFTLTCTGAGGSETKTQTVVVSAAPVTPTDPGTGSGDSGGGPLAWLLLPLAALALRRRALAH